MGIILTDEAADASRALPVRSLRKNLPPLPLFSEAEAAQHFVALSRLDALDAAHGIAATPPPFLARHPVAPDDTAQGFLACLYELQEMLRAATGMAAVSVAPQTEGQSVFACMAMMRAYHDSHGDGARTEILVAAPVNDVAAEAAAQCGYVLREIMVDAQGSIDVAALRIAAGTRTAALLVTHACASVVMDIVRGAGGLMCHLAAHGETGISGVDVDLLGFPLSGGEHEVRAWAVAASKPLAHFLPLPIVGRTRDDYRLLAEKDLPLSIGTLGAPLSNASVLLRAYTGACMRGAAVDSTFAPALKSS